MNRLNKFKKAILYVSDLIVFLLIAVWVVACIFTAIMSVYDLVVNSSAETISQFAVIVGLPFSAGLVIYSARCAITHFFNNKNGKVPDPDFVDESEFEISEDQRCELNTEERTNEYNHYY